MQKTIADTVDLTVLPAPSELVYDLSDPLGQVFEFDTDLMVAVA
ncbi:hypothetical protein [uncultured Amnibacterium sp.]